MPWNVVFHEDFHAEFVALPADVQTALAAKARLLEHFGPALGRQNVDTLAGSKHTNMKELRFDAAGGVWRAAFAFDPSRQAVILVAGDKAGVNQRRFYRALIAAADQRLDGYLEQLKNQEVEMARTLSDVIAALPSSQQQDIEAQAALLIEEETTLRDLRRRTNSRKSVWRRP